MTNIVNKFKFFWNLLVEVWLLSPLKSIVEYDIRGHSKSTFVVEGGFLKSELKQMWGGEGGCQAYLHIR